jgi:hypothetical protein
MRALTLLLVGCLGGRTPAEPAPATPPEPTPMTCTAKLSPGDDLAAAMTEGAVLCLSAGTYPGPLEIAASVTLVGEPGAVIDPDGAGPAVRVLGHQLTITLRGLMLTGGYAEAGSGVYVDGYSDVTLEDCVVTLNRAGTGGATGLYVGMGHVTVRKSRFGPEDDVVATQTGKLTLEEATLEGPLTILEGTEVVARSSNLQGKVTIRGTTSRRPTVTFEGVSATDVHNDPDLPGELVVR